MDEKKDETARSKDEIALNAMLGNGISGWMNNITEEEKRLSTLFLQNPNEFSPLFLGEGKIINCPLLCSRITRIVAKCGVQALDVINELLWGLPEDGRNTPIEFKRARDLIKEMLKGGK